MSFQDETDCLLVLFLCFELSYAEGKYSVQNESQVDPTATVPHPDELCGEACRVDAGFSRSRRFASAAS